MSEVLSVRGLAKFLGGRMVLRELDLACAAGEQLALRGANGSGKTTLLRVIAGVLEPDWGAVRIAGHDRVRARAAALAAVGFVPEAPAFPEALSAREVISLVAALRGTREAPRELADHLGVGPLLAERYGALSLGQRRRVALVAALAGEPPLLLLDEPTNGLDAESSARLLAWLDERRARGGATLIATHDPALFARADRTITLASGGPA